jgi:hypothetical protein
MGFMKNTLAGLLVTLTAAGAVKGEDPSKIAADVFSGQQTTEVVKEPKKEEPLFLDFSIDYQTKYVYRGATYSDKPVIQPVATAGIGPVSATWFGSIDYATKTLNESDVTLDITHPVGPVSLSGGITWLSFPNTDIPSTTEVYAGVTLDEVPATPSLFVFHDFQDGKGTYAELSVSKDFKVLDIPLSASAKLGYNHHYFRKETGFSHVELGVSSPIDLGKGWTISPMLKYSRALSKDFKNEVYAGISIGYKF